MPKCRYKIPSAMQHSWNFVTAFGLKSNMLACRWCKRFDIDARSTYRVHRTHRTGRWTDGRTDGKPIQYHASNMQRDKNHP